VCTSYGGPDQFFLAMGRIFCVSGPPKPGDSSDAGPDGYQPEASESGARADASADDGEGG